MLRYYLSLAWRGLRHTPLFASLMVLTLAVGLAAGMTTNTLRYTLSLDPIPGKSARLLNVQNPARPSQRGGVLFGFAKATALSHLGARYADAAVTGFAMVTSISVDGKQQKVRAGLGIRYVSPTFFRMFNVPLEHGRIWTPAEANSQVPVVVISQGWAAFLFPKQQAVGKHLRIGKTVFTIVGVTGHWNPRPRYYNLASPAGAFGGGGPAVFAPLTAISYAPDHAMVARACRSVPFPPPSTLLSPDCSWLNVWYLARSQHAASILNGIVKNELSRLVPATRAQRMQLLSVRQILARADLVPGSVRLYSLLGLAFLVLCIVNAAGMQLSRVLRGRAQIGIRRALGASRRDIVKQYVFDALLVGGIGGCAGVGLTFAGLYAVRHHVQTLYAAMAHMNGTMLAAVVVLIFVSSLLVGVVPAWIASRADPARVIKAAQ